MKAIICEMCNSNDIVKKAGFYVCQNCGTKYTVDQIERGDEFDESQDEDIVLEEETISEDINVGPLSTFQIKNKKLHFSTVVKCNGNIEINKSVIYYNESEASNGIELDKNASIKISDCIVVCKGVPKDYSVGKISYNYFINCTLDNSVAIENTVFIDCNSFLRSYSCSEFKMKKCKVINSFDHFMELSSKEDTSFEIIENSFIQNGLNDFYSSYLTDISVGCSHINIKDDEANNIVISNSKFVKGEKYRETISSYEENDFEIFSSTYGIKYENCDFEGLLTSISAKSVIGCKFVKCREGINTATLSNSLIADNCVFEKCTNIFGSLSTNTLRIEKCQFVLCYDNIVSLVYHDGVEINYCEFDKCYSFNDSHIISLGIASKENIISNCVFDGIKLGKQYLFDVDSLGGKPNGSVISIRDCEFKNCETSRNDKEIMCKNITVSGFLNKKSNIRVISISNCKGLDTVKNVPNGSNTIPQESDVSIKIQAGSNLDDSTIGMNMCLALEKENDESNQQIISTIYDSTES